MKKNILFKIFLIIEFVKVLTGLMMVYFINPINI